MCYLTPALVNSTVVPSYFAMVTSSYSPSSYTGSSHPSERLKRISINPLASLHSQNFGSSVLVIILKSPSWASKDFWQ